MYLRQDGVTLEWGSARVQSLFSCGFFFSATQAVRLSVTIWCTLISVLWQFRRDNSDLKDGTFSALYM